MEKTRITIKGHGHRKSIEQAGKGEGLAMKIATQGEIRYPHDMKERTRKATKAGSFKAEAIMEKKSQSTLAHRQKTCSMAPIAFTMRT
jgi:hypothetical protein